MNKGIDEGKWIIWAIEYKQSKKVFERLAFETSTWNKEVPNLVIELVPTIKTKA